MDACKTVWTRKTGIFGASVGRVETLGTNRNILEGVSSIIDPCCAEMARRALVSLETTNTSVVAISGASNSRRVARNAVSQFILDGVFVVSVKRTLNGIS